MAYAPRIASWLVSHACALWVYSYHQPRLSTSHPLPGWLRADQPSGKGRYYAQKCLRVAAAAAAATASATAAAANGTTPGLWRPCLLPSAHLCMDTRRRHVYMCVVSARNDGVVCMHSLLRIVVRVFLSASAESQNDETESVHKRSASTA